jgi:hypothetical protein
MHEQKTAEIDESARFYLKQIGTFPTNYQWILFRTPIYYLNNTYIINKKKFHLKYFLIKINSKPKSAI